MAEVFVLVTPGLTGLCLNLLEEDIDTADPDCQDLLWSEGVGAYCVWRHRLGLRADPEVRARLVCDILQGLGGTDLPWRPVEAGWERFYHELSPVLTRYPTEALRVVEGVLNGDGELLGFRLFINDH